MKSVDTSNQILQIMAAAASRQAAKTADTAPAGDFRDLLSGAMEQQAGAGNAAAPAAKAQSGKEGGQSAADGDQAAADTAEASGVSVPAARDSEAEAAAATAGEKTKPAAEAAPDTDPQIAAAWMQAIAPIPVIPVSEVEGQAETAAPPQAAQAEAMPVQQAQDASQQTAAQEQTAIAGQAAQPEQIDRSAQSVIVSAELTAQPAGQTQQAAPQPVSEAAPMSAPVPRDEGQQRFDAMIAKASEELTGASIIEEKLVNPRLPMDRPTVAAEVSKDPVVPEAKPDAVKVPEALRAVVPAENREKLEQPEIIRAAEKNVRSAAQAGEHEETLLTAADAVRGTSMRTETVSVKPLEQPAAERETPAQQIRTQVIENLEQDKMEFRMQLNPQELGKINVRMVLEGGRLSVEIISASAKTTELLGRQTEALAASLRLSGVELQSVQVVTAAEQSDNHMEQSLSMMMNQSRSEGDEAGGGAQGPAKSRQDAGTRQADGEAEPAALLNYTI